jgi:hypothetical protein
VPQDDLPAAIRTALREEGNRALRAAVVETRHTALRGFGIKNLPMRGRGGLPSVLAFGLLNINPTASAQNLSTTRQKKETHPHIATDTTLLAHRT